MVRENEAIINRRIVNVSERFGTEVELRRTVRCLRTDELDELDSTDAVG